MEKWFDVTILEEGDNYTDVQLTVDHIIYRIQDGKTSGYNTIIFKDRNDCTLLNYYERCEISIRA